MSVMCHECHLAVRSAKIPIININLIYIYYEPENTLPIQKTLMTLMTPDLNDTRQMLNKC